MKLLAKWIVLVAVLFSVGLLAGSTLEARQRQQANRDEVEGMMEAYILSKLQETLDLSDEQFGDMVVAQTKLQDTRREFRRQRRDVLRRMRQALSRPEAGEAELRPLLDEWEETRQQFARNETGRYAAIDDVLDVRQQARYRVLEVELQRRLTEMMRQVRGNPRERGRFD